MKEQGGGAQREIFWRGYQVAAWGSGRPCTTIQKVLAVGQRVHIVDDSWEAE